MEALLSSDSASSVLGININGYRKRVWRKIVREVLIQAKQESCVHHFWPVKWPQIIAQKFGITGSSCAHMQRKMVWSIIS